MAMSPPFDRVSPLYRRRTACLLAGLFVFAFALAGSVNAASTTASARISARLTKKSFTVSEAGQVKLVYRFSRPSKSFSYRLTFQNGKK